jgi:hypothetical protein
MGVAAVPYIMMAVSAAAAAQQGMQARAQAKRQERAQSENNYIIRKAAAESYGDVAKAEEDIQVERHEMSLKNTAAFIKARGQVKVMAGATGTYGGAVDSMIRDLNQTRGANMGTLAHNTEVQLDKIRTQQENIRYGAQRQQGTQAFAKPSGFSIALSSIGAGMKGYAAGQDFGTSFAAAQPAAG